MYKVLVWVSAIICIGVVGFFMFHPHYVQEERIHVENVHIIAQIQYDEGTVPYKGVVCTSGVGVSSYNYPKTAFAGNDGQCAWTQNEPVLRWGYE